MKFGVFVLHSYLICCMKIQECPFFCQIDLLKLKKNVPISLGKSRSVDWTIFYPYQQCKMDDPKLLLLILVKRTDLAMICLCFTQFRHSMKMKRWRNPSEDDA